MTTSTDGLRRVDPGDAELPDLRDVGVESLWVLPDDDGRTAVEVPARFIGAASSRRFDHTHAGDHSDDGTRCARCRWFEPRIFRLRTDLGATRDGYVLHIAGRSSVPGETTRSRIVVVFGAHELIEALVTRRASTHTVTLTKPAAQVLAQAATFDDQLEDAYVNRAVS